MSMEELYKRAKEKQVNPVKCSECGHNFNQTQCIKCSNNYASRFTPKALPKEKVEFRYRIEEVCLPGNRINLEKRIILAEYTSENKDKHQWLDRVSLPVSENGKGFVLEIKL